MNNIEICFSPLSYPLYKNNNSVVVVIDVFRATSAICAAIHFGVKNIIPVAEMEEAIHYKKSGYIVAAERDGMVVEGFDMGNSPFSYLEEKLLNQQVVLTTTNGTKALKAARDAYKVVVGAFVNFSALKEFLMKENKNVIFLCAGWKDRYNLEDSLFAGAVAKELLENKNFQTTCDATISSIKLYELAKDNINDFLAVSSHRNRLAKLNLEKDINYCLTKDLAPVVPIFEDNVIKKL